MAPFSLGGGCVWIRVGFVTEKMETTSARASFGFRQVGGIAVNVKEHCTGMITNGGIRVCGCIVEKVNGSFGSGFGALGLGSCKAAKCNKHGTVNGTGIEEEHANNFLETCDAEWVKRGGSISRGSKLSVAAIDRFNPGRGSMLGSRRCDNVEAFESFGNVTGHGEIDGVIVIIPGEGDAAVEFTTPVSGHFVFG